MKKIAIAVAALVMGSMSASAADLAARPYTKAPAAQFWSTTGAASTSAATSAVAGTNEPVRLADTALGFGAVADYGSQRAASFIGGGQVGYD